MITRDEFLSLNFVKKEDFTGSHQGMRFMLHQAKVEREDGTEDKKLQVYIWSEPFSFAATPDEEKVSAYFEFSEEGLVKAIEWMNENYENVRLKKQPT
jgi:aryl-alcohol dehydrogenase-like predicted oxidoreductase